MSVGQLGEQVEVMVEALQGGESQGPGARQHKAVVKAGIIAGQGKRRITGLVGVQDRGRNRAEGKKSVTRTVYGRKYPGLGG